MDYIDTYKQFTGKGFDTSFCQRNEFLSKNKNIQQPKFTKTGTTIVGLKYKDGIVLGADTRATSGPIIADKNCRKFHYLAPNIYGLGAGTAADTEWTTLKLSADLDLMRLNTGRQTRISTAVSRLSYQLFQYGGQIGAALILGGVDCMGPELVYIAPDGNRQHQPFCTMGSGSIAATAILETKYRDDLSEEEAKKIVIEAVEAGIFHDLGSGSNVDICVVKKDKTDIFRNLKSDNKKTTEPYPYKFIKNNTPVIKQIQIEFEKIEIKEDSNKMQIEK